MLRLTAKLFAVLVLFSATLITFAGCGEGGGSAVSALPAGSGYKVILSATPREINTGGSVALMATIFDPHGNAVGNEDGALLFSSDAPDSTFDPTSPVDVKSGTGQTSMKWEDKSDADAPAASRLCNITASYRGAIASVQITLISKSF